PAATSTPAGSADAGVKEMALWFWSPLQAAVAVHPNVPVAAPLSVTVQPGPIPLPVDAALEPVVPPPPVPAAVVAPAPPVPPAVLAPPVPLAPLGAPVDAL